MPSPKPKSNTGLIYAAIIVVVVAVVALALLQTHNSKKSPTATNSNGGNSASSQTGAQSGGTARLYLSPDKSSVAAGGQLTVLVRADSGSTDVNAVEADVSYPANKLTFVSISDSGSGYGVKAQATGGSGVVKIARGNTKPLTGDQAVASITFKVNSGANGVAGLNFLSSSAVVSSTTNKNVLGSLSGGSYTLQ